MVRSTNKQTSTTTTTTAASSAIWWIVSNKADYLPYKGNIVLGLTEGMLRRHDTEEEQLHLSGTSRVRLELSATQPAWRGEGSSLIKRAVRESRDPAGHYKRIQPPEQTKTKNRTNRRRDERQARPAQPQTDETVNAISQTSSTPTHPPTLPAPSAIQSLPSAAVDITVSLFHLIQNLDAWRWS